MNSRPRILAVDDNEDALFALEQLLLSHSFEVVKAFSGTAALERVSDSHPDIILLDINMPGIDGYEVLARLKSDIIFRYIPVVLLTAKDSLEDIIEGLNKGADDYVRKPYVSEELIARVQTALSKKALYSELRQTQETNERLSRKLGELSAFASIIGKSSSMGEVFDLIQKVLDAQVPVLISGESGTGKELVARAIHFNGPRKGRPFIAQNCAAFSESLLESELFGHVRGAFTGAIKDRDGLFQTADGGTLFLDEIGEMPTSLQAKLLRVLQDGTFSPVGDTKLKKVDVRILAATNRKLESMISEGKFREDLFYRLNVVNISLPPLRERREDIPLLIDSFMAEVAKRASKSKKQLSPEALKAFIDFYWPGNVRQLQNEIERLCLLSGEQLEVPISLLSPALREGKVTEDSKGGAIPSNLKEAMEALEKKMIIEALKRLHGNKSEAARELGISRSNLISKVQSYGLED